MPGSAIQSLAADLRSELRRRARAGARWVYPTGRGSASFRPPATSPEPAPSPAPAADALRVIREEVGECTRCKLHSGRTHIVFGVGNPRARLMFIGEGPGQDEDEQGEPFVGKAGQLLTRIIEAIGLTRADVYINNIVMCRPPNNRNPEPDEIAACSPFLARRIEAIQPAIIVVLGNVAAKTLLNTGTGIMRLRGNWREYQGIPVMPTFHPAYLLRTPGDKRLVWEDMQKVAVRYNEGLPPGEKPARPKGKGD